MNSKLKQVLKIIFILAYFYLSLQVEYPFNVGINNGSSNQLLGVLSINLVQPILLILFLILNRFWLHIKINFRGRNWSGLLFFGWPALIVTLANCSGDQIVWKALRTTMSTSLIFKAAVLALLSGIIVASFEEVLLRGGVYGACRAWFEQNSIVKSVIVSSLLFSALHSLNFMNQSFWDTTNQLVYTIGLGVLFASIYEVTQNLFIPIILHALINASNEMFNMHSLYFSSGSATGIEWTSILIFVGFTIVGYGILVWSQRRQGNSSWVF
ncbi:CPBP family intramembrane metalloprotease [Lactobacillus sp. DCY120]|uniref:CPBP family intramembrane metalloprotease n=1 Tax=Bombilactobacillus apium TaxID=2675299 RepID=A0A850R102_9LACO|nr:type II CAAX endopeptidase family protein [Bombilactobacillus apium]NVY96759.1 CPBP family intramembrane metalloprotease [Bombilactobacillus apium]